MELIQAGEKELVELKNFRELTDYKELPEVKKNRIEKKIIRLELALSQENPFHEYKHKYTYLT